MMTRPRLIPMFAAAALGSVLWHAPRAAAQGDWELVDRDLGRERVELTQLRDGMVWFTDIDGRTRSSKVAALIAIIHDEPAPDRPARELPWIRQQAELFGPLQGSEASKETPFEQWITLTDGQRWSGKLARANGEALTWSIRGVVEVPVDLERVREIVLQRAPSRVAAGVEDRVLLVNGDALSGFVAALGDPTRVEAATGNAEVPLDRVAAVTLANPAVHSDGIMVWTDADVLAVAGLEVRVTGRVALQLGSESPDSTIELPTSDLRAVLFEHDAVSPLASIAPSRIEATGTLPGGVEPASPEAALPLDAAPIGLRGPVVVAWALPRPGVRFAARAVLPPAMWAWGDCEVVVRAAGTELLRERLNAARPEASINVPLGGAKEFEVEVDSGASGAVQDHITLEAPMVSWR